MQIKTVHTIFVLENTGVCQAVNKCFKTWEDQQSGWKVSRFGGYLVFWMNTRYLRLNDNKFVCLLF